MKDLVIASLNVKNRYFLVEDSLPHQLAHIIRDKDIDVLFTQEMTLDYRLKMLRSLSEYRAYGFPRYGQTNSFLKDRGNETCSLILKKENKYVKARTKWLSETPDEVGSKVFWSWCPRIASIVDLESGLKLVNLHLDNLFSFVRARQLEILSSLLEEDMDRPMVIAGDFNTMDKKKKYFEAFKERMLENGLQYVDFGDNTYEHFGAFKLDHMFIPKDWEITGKSLEEVPVSDHKMLVLRTKTPTV